MMNDYYKDLWEKIKSISAINDSLKNPLYDKLCEECGELVTALMRVSTKTWIGEDELLRDVISESADVLICIFVLMNRINKGSLIEVFQDEIDYKLNRTIERFERYESV